jgi:GNAT superfamily N-acetyltransferase
VTEPAIRRIEPGDWEAARALRLRSLLLDPSSFAMTHAHEASLSDGHWARRARMLADGDGATQLLAVDATGPVGSVTAVRDSKRSDVFNIYAMWVAPEQRGSGLGARLIAAAERWIAEAGGCEAALSVTTASPAAQRLYARAGYEPDGTSVPSQHTPGLIEINLRKPLRS